MTHKMAVFVGGGFVKPFYLTDYCNPDEQPYYSYFVSQSTKQRLYVIDDHLVYDKIPTEFIDYFNHYLLEPKNTVDYQEGQGLHKIVTLDTELKYPGTVYFYRNSANQLDHVPRTMIAQIISNHK